VTKTALGTKRICAGCAAKFYDLGKDPIVCPTCDTVYVVAPPPPPRGGRGHAPRGAYDAKAETAIGSTLNAADAPASDEAEHADGTEDTEVGAAEDETDDAQEAGGVPMLEELDEK